MKITRKGMRASDEMVAMTPLIDCVFLLLIFFLVTSQLKRWERMIPITLADPTASVAKELRSTAALFGMDAGGRFYQEAGRDENGVVQFAPAPNAEKAMAELIARSGPTTPVELIVEQDTPFQRVIDTLDMMQHQGLSSVRSRVRNGKIQP